MKIKIIPLFSVIFFLIIFLFFYKGLQNSNIYVPKNTIKKERNLTLSNLVKKKANLFYKSFIGKKVTVLVEDRKQADGLLKGHSEHYIPVRIDARGALQNQLIPVLITEVKNNELIGCLES